MSSADKQPAGALTRFSTDHNPALSGFSTRDIVAELIARTLPGDTADTQELAFLGHKLARNLSRFTDVFLNRHSACQVSVIFRELARSPLAPPLQIEGKTWVELGCGSTNPFAFSFVLLALGATKAVPIDLEPIHDFDEAYRTVADIAKQLLVDPAHVVGVDSAISRQAILENIADFDLAELGRGSPKGLSPRLSYRNESVYSMTVPPSSVDVVVSNAFLEHVPDPEAAVSSIAEITKPGGYGIHIIDMIDHRSYGHQDFGPLEFLKIKSDEKLVHGCNRLRPREFVDVFEQNGFEVLDLSLCNPVVLSDTDRKQFVPPWQQMALDDLRHTCLKIAVRRRD